jgi:hypothetical protein
MFCPVSHIVQSIYCNGFDQLVARQQLCKHGPTRKQDDSSKLEEYSSYELRVVVAAKASEKQASQFSIGDSHGKFVVEVELEVGLWRLDV